MSFMMRQGRHCQFLEENLKSPLPRKFQFPTSDKIVELVEHTGALRDLACRQWDQQGQRWVWLVLTREQYGKLTMR
jgi:hypothetical protein